jgi:hypothetical protein
MLWFGKYYLMTPERKVKNKVAAILKEHKAYFFYPMTGGYGRSGIPDIICCASGKFIGIECKANGNKPTPLQQRELNRIRQSGGFVMVVDETNLIELEKSLTSFCKGEEK